MNDANDNEKLTGLFSIPFPYAQGEKTFEKKVIIRKGEEVEVNAFTPFAQRLSDVSVYLLQIEAKKKGFNYYKIKDEVAKDLSVRLREKGFNNYGELTTKQKKIVNIAINQGLHKKLKEMGTFEISIGFKELVNLIDEKKLLRPNGNIRFDRVIESIQQAQSNSKISWKEWEVTEDMSDYHVVVGSSVIIPDIAFVVDKELEGIDSIEDLLKSPKRNKDKYIKEVRITFSPKAFALLALPRSNKRLQDLKKRHFNSIYSFFLDMFLKSIEGLPYPHEINKLTFGEAQKLFGTSYAKYITFKKNVLDIAMEETNENNKKYGGYQVELVEKRKNDTKKGELLNISFKLHHQNNHLIKGGFSFDLAYYIATRHYYFDTYITKEISESFSSYLEFIKEQTEKRNEYPNLVIAGDNSTDLSLEEWAVEHDEAQKAYNKLYIFINEDAKWFEKFHLKFSTDFLCLVDVKNRPIQIMGGTWEIINPITSLKYYLDEKGMSGEEQ
jgi:hypothetical protein